MSKHFKFSLDCDPNTGARSLLRGTPVVDASVLHEAYKESEFHYQFRRPNGYPSRIMVCSDPGELLWLEEQVKRGVELVIHRNYQSRSLPR